METFPSAAEFSSWAGVCPGSNQTADVNHSSRCPKGNRFVRHLLNQATHAAVKKRGSRWHKLFLHFLQKMEYKEAIVAVAHALARTLWKILHTGVRYIEQGERSSPAAEKRRIQKYKQHLRKLGYTVLPPATPQPLAVARP